MGKQLLAQFQVTGQLVYDAARRVPEQVEAVRARLTLDAGTFERRIQDNITKMVLVVRPATRSCEDEILITIEVGLLRSLHRPRRISKGNQSSLMGVQVVIEQDYFSSKPFFED